MVGRGTITALDLKSGREASRSSARGRARLRTDWYLRLWTRVPMSSSRSPTIKVGGRSLQCLQLPDFDLILALQFGQMLMR